MSRVLSMIPTITPLFKQCTCYNLDRPDPGSLQPVSQPQSQYRDHSSNLGLTSGDLFGRLGPESPLTHPQQASLWLGALDPLRGWREGWARQGQARREHGCGNWLAGWLHFSCPASLNLSVSCEQWGITQLLGKWASKLRMGKVHAHGPWGPALTCQQQLKQHTGQMAPRN